MARLEAPPRPVSGALSRALALVLLLSLSVLRGGEGAPAGSHGGGLESPGGTLRGSRHADVSASDSASGALGATFSRRLQEVREGANSVGRVSELENELDRATTGSKRGKFMAQLEKEEAGRTSVAEAAEEDSAAQPGDYGEEDEEVAIENPRNVEREGDREEDEVAVGSKGMWRREGDPEEDEVAVAQPRRWRQGEL